MPQEKPKNKPGPKPKADKRDEMAWTLYNSLMSNSAIPYDPNGNMHIARELTDQFLKEIQTKG